MAVCVLARKKEIIVVHVCAIYPPNTLDMVAVLVIRRQSSYLADVISTVGG
jgi:hypothetical protein